MKYLALCLSNKDNVANTLDIISAGQKLEIKIEGRFGKTWTEKVTVVMVSDILVLLDNGMQLPTITLEKSLV